VTVGVPGRSDDRVAVLIVAEGGDAGGIGRYCVDLAEAEGDRALLACLCAAPCTAESDCWLAARCAERDLPLARVAMPPKGWRSGMRGLSSLWRRAGRPVVHVNGRRGNAVALALRLGMPGFRYVTTVHGILGLHSRRNAVYRVVDLAAARLATGVIAVSEHGRRQLLRARSPQTRTVTIANGLAARDLAALRAIAAERPAAGRVGEPARIGFLGRLSPEKGTDELVAVARQLAAAGAGATLDIAGDGPDRETLTARLAAVADGTGLQVCLRGTVGDVRAFLGEVDVLVVPSHNEGMPYGVLEAMAAGCAVVAFGVGGIPEVISGDELGVLVEPGDVDAIGAAVVALASDPTRVAALGRAASTHIEQRFALADRLPALWRTYGLAAEAADR